MSCGDTYCDVPVQGAIYVVNYTGLDTYATFVELATESNGKISTNPDGSYVILSGSSEMAVPPSLNSGGCNFTILQGFSKWNGISVRTADSQYLGTFYKASGQITTSNYTNSEGAGCTHYWFSYGYTSGGKNIAVTSAGGTPTDAYPTSWLVVDGQYYYSSTFSWMRIVLILLIFVIAIIVAVFLIKKYKTG
jgi:hypothetical protein